MTYFIRAFVCLLAVVGNAVASGSDQSQALLDMVKSRDKAIQDIVRSETNGETPKERAKLKTIVGGLFDFKALSELSLGRSWAERTDEEQKAFIDLNRRLIEKNYADPKLYTKAEKIEYAGVELDGKDALVKTVVHYKTEESNIDYQMHQVGDKWLIYDMIVDDLSIGKSNRSQFRREMRKSSFEGLMEKLRKKLDADASGEKGASSS
ncbi:MAG: ABC transporter substrate-binding protein [Candidatus Latescibacteria bacterium]|jgi:phospholipid transport system substrate-binding protein|nr:ABC transporter substrate-binding protein [Candidatus Latescibacterota bacterium]MBT4140874.1 ABC transporter substrate-binding protein [Candidatus Latescibacterota bacterium]